MTATSNIIEDDIEIIKKWLKKGSIDVFGLPFSGKDSQGKKLAIALDASLLGGGEILRASDHETVKKVIAAGHLAPTDDFLKIVLPYLSRPEFKTQALILNAVGRWHGEEEAVIQATAQSGHKLKAVISLKIDEQTARQRWQAQDASAGHHRGIRHDDDANAFNVRLKVFRAKTIPVIAFYRDKGMLIKVDGSGPANEVFNRIIKSLASFAKPKK